MSERAMTVRELRKALNDFDEDLPVYVKEGPLCFVKFEVAATRLELFTGEGAPDHRVVLRNAR